MQHILFFFYKIANFRVLVESGAVFALTVMAIGLSFYIIRVLYSSANTNYREQMIADHDFISIPDSKKNKNNLLYVKLGYQTCVNVLSSKPKSLYSKKWGWACLDLHDRITISVAGVRAQSTGQLQGTGHDVGNISGSPLVIINSTRRAAARFNLVRVIRENDV